MLWPNNIKYTDKLIWDPSTRSRSPAVAPQDILTVKHSEKQNKLFIVKQISNASHPAFKQYGLFAKKKIPPNTWIIDYCGYVTDRCSTTSDYVLTFYDNLSIDAELVGNEARMVNDFRGILERPNCQFKLYKDVQSLKMGVFSMNSEIKKGQELCVTYGKSYWKARTGVVPNI